MRYNLILACADGVDDARTLAVAADLAARHRAVVRVVPTGADVAVDLVAFGLALGPALTGASAQAVADDEQASHLRIEAAARAAAEASGLSFGRALEARGCFCCPTTRSPVSPWAAKRRSPT
ncbi:MAG: hypothetical protein EON86_01635 [Brevundimonas sp.]|nr:MAG: hypothetical protein EON86_01635 [Brevundimonas sp.]